MATNKQKQAAASTFDLNSTLLLLLLFCSLFIYQQQAREPFVSVRMLALALTGMAAAAALFFRQKTWTLPGRPAALLALSGGLFWLLQLLATTQAQNIPESIFFVARYGLNLALLLLMLQLLSQPARQSLLIARALTLTLALQSLVGIAQYYEILPWEIPGIHPPTGFSGNRNLFGSLVVLLMPWSLYTFLRGSGSWKITAGLALLLGSYALILSQTRSAWLAFAVMLLTFGLLTAFSYKRLSVPLQQQIKTALVLALAGIALAGTLALAGGQDSTLARSLRSRLASLSSLSLSASAAPANEAERNAYERLYVWKETWRMTRDAPLLGVGPGNWRVAFPAYGGSGAPSFENVDHLRVHPHNSYLGLASESGLTGLLLLLLMGALVLRPLLSNLRQSDQEASLLLSIALISGLLAAAVDMAFSFPLERVEHSSLLLLYAALGVSVGRERLPAVALPRLPLTLVLTALLSFAAWASWQKQQLDTRTQAILQLEQNGNYERALQQSLEAEQLFFTIDAIGDPLQWHSANAYKQLKQYEQALQKIDEAALIQPNSHRVLNTRASILMAQEKYAEAVPVLEKTIALAPDYQPALVNLAYALYRTDQLQAALSTMERVDFLQNEKLLPVMRDAGIKYESQALEATPLYSIGRQLVAEIKNTGSVQTKQLLINYRQQQTSDQAFVDNYFGALNHYCRLKMWERGAGIAQVNDFSRRLEALRKSMLQAQGARAAADKLLNNNHLKTVDYLLASPALDDYETAFFSTQ